MSTRKKPDKWVWVAIRQLTELEEKKIAALVKAFENHLREGLREIPEVREDDLIQAKYQFRIIKRKNYKGDLLPL